MKLPQPGQRILAVEGLELFIDPWIGLVQQVRGAEEVFAGDGEELRRVFRGVGIDEGFCVGVLVQLAVEVVEGLLHGVGPVADAHVGVQWRQAVGVAVEHVEFVRQFVDHQVVAVPAAAGHHAVPGQDDRALGPGFAAVFAVPFVLDAAGVAVALGAEEVVGVEDDFVEALVPVQLAQVHQRQLGLGGEEQALFLVQFDAGQGGEVFIVQEQHAGFPQPLVLGGADAVEEAQLLAHPLPGVLGHRVFGEGASAAPVAQGPHGDQRGWAFEARWFILLRTRLMIIGSSDTRMMPTTSSDRFCLMKGTLPKK